jgi:hypothetical protein
MRADRGVARRKIEAVKIIAAWSLPAAASPAQSERTPVVDDRAAEAPADPALVADVRRQLSASDLAVVAHGAYAAAEHRLGGTAPELRLALSRLRAQQTNEEKLCAMAVLDALVRTDAGVPPDELAPFARQGHGAALVLLARDPRRSERVLLELFIALGRGSGEPTSIPWLAAGGLLLGTRAPGFAAAVLGELRLDLDVIVRDGEYLWGDFGELDPHRIRKGRRDVPKAFPPIADYLLTQERDTGEALLTGDPYPVSWSRVVERGSQRFQRVEPRNTSQDRVRVTWLLALAGIHADALDLDASTTLHLSWTDARDLADRIARARASVEERWRGLRGELARQGLLARDEVRGSMPCVRVTVFDHRQVTEPPLEIAGAEIQRQE